MHVFHKLKTALLCLAALLCVGFGTFGTLGAQDLKASFKVALVDPAGDANVSGYFTTVRSAFTNALTNAGGFTIVDRAKTDQILKEHNFQRTKGMFAPTEARDLGKMLGADYICWSELAKDEFGDLSISFQVLDIVTGVVVGSGTVDTEETAQPRVIRQKCEEEMMAVLKNVIKRVPSNKNPQLTMLNGLELEISKYLISFKGNTKWNKKRANNELDLEADLSGVTLEENNQFGTSVYAVSGNISMNLTDGRGSSWYELEVEEFAEMSKERIRNKLMTQIKSKTANIIRELLTGLDDQ